MGRVLSMWQFHAIIAVNSPLVSCFGCWRENCCVCVAIRLVFAKWSGRRASICFFIVMRMRLSDNKMRSWQNNDVKRRERLGLRNKRNNKRMNCKDRMSIRWMINTMMVHSMMISSNSMMSQVVHKAMRRRIGICLRRQLMIGAMMSSKRNRNKDMLISNSNSQWLMSMVNSNNSSSSSMISKDMDSSNSNMRIQMMVEWECKIGKLDGDISLLAKERY